jgi:parallel beta-helix repeat protein
LSVELLEDRTVPTTYTVTTNADSGLGSLRQAILNANKHIGADRIVFNIPSSFLTISLVSALPAITDPVTIDGTTQKGSTGSFNPVTIDGTLAGSLASGFVVQTRNTTIKGLIIQDFAVDGIWINGVGSNGNTIVQDQIRLNGQVGVVITNGANNMIGGTSTANENVITQNGGDGVWISGSRATGNRVRFNLIGTDSTGLALGNGTNGVEISQGAHGNRVRGNEIVANGGTGVYIHDAGTNNNVVRGNLIGTDGSSSESTLGNHAQGVDIALGAANNSVIGGNTIGGNLGTGIYIHDKGTTGNTISGNFIGTDSTGTNNLGNGLQGVDIRNGANGNMIGGSTAAAGNLIAYNGDYGVLVIDSSDKILSNNIFFNHTRGIGEFGTGNNGQPAPTFNSATVSGGTTTITGNLAQPNTTVLIQLFKKGANGQEVLVFSGNVKTDAKGNFTLQLTGLVSGDDLIATATLGNNTSVFSNDLLVQ